MLDVVSKMAEFLTKQAVFESVVRALADQVPRGGIHQEPSFDSRLRRAFSLRIAMKSEALTNASYSARSPSLRRPSLARSASASTLCWTFAATWNSATRRADAASRHRLNGSKRLSSTPGAITSLMLSSYHAHRRPLKAEFAWLSRGGQA